MTGGGRGSCPLIHISLLPRLYGRAAGRTDTTHPSLSTRRHSCPTAPRCSARQIYYYSRFYRNRFDVATTARRAVRGPLSCRRAASAGQGQPGGSALTRSNKGLDELGQDQAVASGPHEQLELGRQPITEAPCGGSWRHSSRSAQPRPAPPRPARPAAPILRVSCAIAIRSLEDAALPPTCRCPPGPRRGCWGSSSPSSSACWCRTPPRRPSTPPAAGQGEWSVKVVAACLRACAAAPPRPLPPGARRGAARRSGGPGRPPHRPRGPRLPIAFISASDRGGEAL